MRTTRLPIAATIAALVLAGLGGAASAAPSGVSGPSPAALTVTGPAEKVAKLTGPGSINATDTRWQLKATDLGIMWDNGNGQVLTVFGDTFGNGWTGPGGGVGNGATIDWRCNTLVRSADRNLADGMTFDSAVLDRAGHAGTILPCKQIDNNEMTVIPTAAISVGSRQFIHYMSVNHWGDAGRWYTNYSGIAYSDDNGQTWIKDADARWQNTPAWDNRFQLGAMLRQGGFVYLYGTMNGRFGNTWLARVPEGSVLEPTAYRYWNGSAWVTDQWATVPVATGPVGELSVIYSRYLGRFVMTYLNESRGALVLRTAPTPTGPWSAEEVLATTAQYPGLYGAFIHPWSADSDSPYLYFTMAQWDPYNVWLMRTKLTGGGMFARSSTDFTGDHRSDVITFTQNDLGDVYVAPSTGGAFAGGGKWHDWFAPFNETALTGDFNGDGRDDIATFTHAPLNDVYVALSTGSGFGAGAKWHDWFAGGNEIPAVGDVNGDGRDDIVTFTHDGEGDVYVALSNGTSFVGTAAKWHEFFAPWGEFPALGDVNGDGRDDLITFTQGSTDDVFVALSTGTSFGAGQKWHDFFGLTGESPRVGDVNGDGRDDIVVFTCDTNADVFVALSTGTGFTGTTARWNDFFCTAGEFPYLADANGDGKDDILVFTQAATNDVYVGLSNGTSFAAGVKWNDFFGLTGEREF
ncbi:hypothetical protein Cs7R123_52640 [Catellatospora sp. TT07R-123]|uniref:DUF4185 domain-containing protein n=1 Tax=Catellatospora sp. TT07R-123 TaxID=2733863 RepID=UPI001AFD69F5|nr:DUF4185 domain-containing protein [Catellatospora sp. TT07R-123]GHJ47922.1 hypothetical protein Cs7R123_52640 [Catellatospora sp. TT07R-123]